jgi:hypothetical protein
MEEKESPREYTLTSMTLTSSNMITLWIVHCIFVNHSISSIPMCIIKESEAK